MTRIFYAAFLTALAQSSFAIAFQTVPELDGTGALAAVALLAGVVALAAEKRRRGR